MRRLATTLATVLTGLAAGAIPAAAAPVEFGLTDPARFPVGIAAGSDGNLWIAELGATPAEGDRIARMTPAGVVTEFAIPADDGRGHSAPVGITAGPDGALWFTESWRYANRIGRMTTSGQLTEYVIPTPWSEPSDIVVGPDGNLWFTESRYSAYGNRIGRITPAGVITEFCVRGACGNAANAPADVAPQSIVAGPDGALWFTERAAGGNAIGRITTNGEVDEFALPTANAEPYGIAVGPDGNLWFTERAANKIGRITPAGEIVEYPVPTAGAQPTDIVAGSDGNLWFTEFSGNRLGRVTPQGLVTEQSPLAAANSGPNRIITGPDGNLWFTESGAGRVARTPPEPPPRAVSGAAQEAGEGIAVLTGTVTANGVPTTYYFDYGFFSDYDARTDPVAAGSGTAPVEVSTTLRGLYPGVQYHFRIVAVNEYGTAYGEDRTFALPWPPAPVAPAPAPPPPPPPPPPEPPSINGLRVVRSYIGRDGHRRRGIALRMRVSAPGALEVAVRRRGARAARRLTKRARRGLNVVRLGSRLRPGRYTARLVATDAVGASAPATIRFRVFSRAR